MYHFKNAASETKEEREKRLMGGNLYSLYVCLRSVYNDIVTDRPNGRGKITMEQEGLEQWKGFFEWIFEHYKNMFKNRNLKVYMFVGTMRTQRVHFKKEVEKKEMQISMFSVENKKEIESILKKIAYINILEAICYQGVDSFFEFLYH